jgi:hypothetical protein
MMNILWLKWFLSIAILSGGMPIPEPMVPEPALSVFINDLFAARAQILIDNNPKSIRNYYLENIKSSQYAYQHEARRSEYLNTWASHRGVKFTKAEVKIRITRQREQVDTARVSVVNTMQLTYEYPGLEPAKQQFGLGTRHGITLKKVNGHWHLKSEWYSDPLDEDPAMISVYEENQKRMQPEIVQAAHKKYNRMQAVAYADKYAGDAWGADNDHKYNKKYKDYTHLGGDCTNFASQVIGDQAEGGGLKMTSNWYYRYKQGGSEAWVRTDSFKSFLVYRGYGRIIARGGFKDLSVPSSRFPNGAFAKLELGDLIAYEIKGDVDHFCILTGRDPKGYPLVNSHSSDRFHVPMDLGWDKKTKFSLIHIRD